MHILLLEDHDDSRAVIANLLGHCGHTVATAQNLEEAFALLDKNRFDVLLSDIGLPDGEAFKLVQESKGRHRVEKAVALTGREDDNVEELCQQAGFDHFLTKPVDFHQLRSLLG